MNAHRTEALQSPPEALQIPAETSVDGRCLDKDHDSSKVMTVKRGEA